VKSKKKRNLKRVDIPAEKKANSRKKKKIVKKRSLISWGTREEHFPLRTGLEERKRVLERGGGVFWGADVQAFERKTNKKRGYVDRTGARV